VGGTEDKGKGGGKEGDKKEKCGELRDCFYDILFLRNLKFIH
jgi:hypothetical protein